ncbi:MAG TPA: phosphoribosylanthranilate isomerase [Phaeodactylibacter sp.]|nr:phosphoribosylanthranilate isomerase [Phaeodactylibacter sp.]
MKGTLNPRVKICCISSKKEARLAIEYGASALGLVGNMPSGPGVISEMLIKEIAGFTPPPIATFLLTSEVDAASIIAQHKSVHTNTIQLVDKIPTENFHKIRTALPNIKLVQVIHVIDEKSVEDAIYISKYVDAILLDSGNPNLKIKELGGTGRVHNWDLSKEIREKISIPLFLAGGLNANNIREAIEYVQPFGVDLCSGVRTGGELDEGKLSKFFEKINIV